MSAELVRLATLPPYGLFTTSTTGMRGLVLRWLRTKFGKRREALVLLTGQGCSVRKLVHADVRVLIEDRFDPINGSPKPTYRDDIFKDCFPAVFGGSCRRVAMPRRPWMARPGTFTYAYEAVFP